jgi:hypothetical protein
VPDPLTANHDLDFFAGKRITYETKGFVRPKTLVVSECDDSAGFLTTMLERVETKVDQARSLWVAEDTNDTALFMQLIV